MSVSTRLKVIAIMATSAASLLACMASFAGDRDMRGRTLTCVVAIKTEHGVIMGCDSCAGGRTSAVVIEKPCKVAKVGEFLIGYTTSFRMGEILHKCITPMGHDPRKDIFDEIVTVLVPQLRKEFKDQGYLVTHEGSDWGGEFILAHGKRIFHVYDDFCVIEYADHFAACGCGEELAMGAMHALDVVNQHKAGTTTPKEMLQAALETAAKYSGFVKPPFHFVQNFQEPVQDPKPAKGKPKK